LQAQLVRLSNLDKATVFVNSRYEKRFPLFEEYRVGEKYLGSLDFFCVSKQVFYEVPEIKLLINEYGCVKLLFLLEHEFVGHLSFADNAFALEEGTRVFFFCKLGLLLDSDHPTGLAASLPTQCSTGRTL
jgi:hypothetical protein